MDNPEENFALPCVCDQSSIEFSKEDLRILLNQKGEQLHKYVKENEVLKEKVAMYERLLHDIQLNAEVTLNAKTVAQLIRNICQWSYSHRVGENITEEERKILIKNAFNNLRNIEKH